VALILDKLIKGEKRGAQIWIRWRKGGEGGSFFVISHDLPFFWVSWRYSLKRAPFYHL